MTTPTEQLPAYLRRRDGRLELVTHCTHVQDFEVCNLKFWLRYGLQVEGTGAKAALNYGSAIHEALAMRYKTQTLPLSAVEPGQMDLLIAYFDEHPQPSEDYRNATRAQDLVRAYNVEYPAHDWEVLAVEEEFEVEVGLVWVTATNQTESEFCTTYRNNEQRYLIARDASTFAVPVYLAGRKDLVVSWHGGLWVVDHKTASQWGGGDSNSALDEGRMSFQFRGYAWAEREAQRTFVANFKLGAPTRTDALASSPRAVLPVLGTVGNYLVSRKPLKDSPGYGTISDAWKERHAINEKRGVSRPRNHFHMEPYPYTPEELDEWRAECLAKAALILQRHAANDWQLHRNRGSCGHWGRCEFYDYCVAAPKEREALLATTLYQPKLIEPAREE